MEDKYRIDPSFVVPEPTAAHFFYYCSEDEYRAGAWHSVMDEWRDQGVKQTRVTIVNDEYPNEPYPHGVWFEGWTDENARMLPFGHAESPGGAAYPPLTYGDKLHCGTPEGPDK